MEHEPICKLQNKRYAFEVFIPWFKFFDFSKLASTSICPLYFPSFYMTRIITTLFSQCFISTSILYRNCRSIRCLFQATFKHHFSCKIIVIWTRNMILAIIWKRRCSWTVLALCRGRFLQRRWNWPCRVPPEAAKGGGGAPPGNPRLSWSQLVVEVRLSVHQERQNSHGIIFALLTQKKKGQATAITRSWRRKEPSPFYCQEHWLSSSGNPKRILTKSSKNIMNTPSHSSIYNSESEWPSYLSPSKVFPSSYDPPLMLKFLSNNLYRLAVV